MAEHTPGPWFSRKSKNHLLNFVVDTPNRTSAIAAVQHEPDARLIAAAPDMLAALKLTEFGFNHARCNVCAGFDGKGENDKRHSADCPVAAAIAKATNGAC